MPSLPPRRLGEWKLPTREVSPFRERQHPVLRVVGMARRLSFPQVRWIPKVVSYEVYCVQTFRRQTADCCFRSSIGVFGVELDRIQAI